MSIKSKIVNIKTHPILIVIFGIGLVIAFILGTATGPDKQLIIPTWVLAFGTIALVIADLFISKKEHTEQKNRNEYDALYQVYSRLNNNHRRNTRIRMIRLSVTNDLDKKIKILEDLDPYDKSGIKGLLGRCKNDGERKEIGERIVEINEIESRNEVKWDFEQIGNLFKEGTVLRRKFLDIYWRIVIICWKVLEWTKDKDPSKKSLFVINISSFESLYKDALKLDEQGQIIKLDEQGQIIEDHTLKIAEEYNE